MKINVGDLVWKVGVRYVQQGKVISTKRVGLYDFAEVEFYTHRQEPVVELLSFSLLHTMQGAKAAWEARTQDRAKDDEFRDLCETLLLTGPKVILHPEQPVKENKEQDRRSRKCF